MKTGNKLILHMQNSAFDIKKYDCPKFPIDVPSPLPPLPR